MDHLRYKFMYAFDAALNSAENLTKWLSNSHQWVSKKCNQDKMVVFERGDAVMVFNFHPTQSYSDYRVGCLKPGKYKIILNSDAPAFGALSPALSTLVTLQSMPCCSEQFRALSIHTLDRWLGQRQERCRVLCPGAA